MKKQKQKRDKRGRFTKYVELPCADANGCTVTMAELQFITEATRLSDIAQGVDTRKHEGRKKWKN
jgi:hypothetical protein